MGRSWVTAAMVAVAAAAVAATLMADAARLGYQAVETVHFDGRVLCQDCTEPGSEWIHGKPIKGARVAVTCLDWRRRVVYHASGATEDNGEFDLPVSTYAGGEGKAPIMKPAEDCTVRLVSSPAKDCSIMTDFGGGQGGAKPDQPSALRTGVDKYTVGPFFFTSPTCAEEADEHDEQYVLVN